MLKRERQRGQVVVFMALALVVLLGMMALTIDGGNALVQDRKAQNAADFGSLAGTRALQSFCDGNSLAPSTQVVANAVSDVVADDDPSATWSALYINGAGTPISASSFSSTLGGGVPAPTGACGVDVSVQKSWPSFFSQIIGFDNATGTRAATSYTPSSVIPTAIEVLDRTHAHSVFGGGNGNLAINGDVFINTVPALSQHFIGDGSPFTNAFTGWNGSSQAVYVDTIDTKAGSAFTVSGNINGVAELLPPGALPQLPLDPCFSGSNRPRDVGTPPFTCGTASIQYNQIIMQQNHKNDPLAGMANPFQIPGGATPPGTSCGSAVDPAPFSVSGVVHYQPGIYTGPLYLNGNVTPSVQLDDCPGGQYGLFRFMQGIQVTGPAMVTGTNVVVATQEPLNGPTPSQIPSPPPQAGVSDASWPFLGIPAAVDDSDCSGFKVKCLIDGGDPGYASGHLYTFGHGAGENYSVDFGGTGSIDITAPNLGPYRNIALYQDPSSEQGVAYSGTAANFGFDANGGDSANIHITGLVYNASLSDLDYTTDYNCPDASGGWGSCPWYQSVWIGPGGVDPHAGGVIQTGVPGSGLPGYPSGSSGNVVIDGGAVVQDFNSDGGPNGPSITINSRSLTIPGPPQQPVLSR